MTIKKILTANVKNIVPAYNGKLYFHRSDSKGKNGLTRYGKPQGSMSGHASYPMMGRDAKGQFVSPKNVNA